MYCKKHPNVETPLSCGRCEQPICTHCSVHTDVGIRCRDCAPRQRRSIGSRGTLLGVGIGALILIIVGTSIASGDLNLGGNRNQQSIQDVFDEFGEGGFNGAVTVNEFVDPWQPVPGQDQPAPGRRFIALDVTVESPESSQFPVYVSSYEFKLTDSDDFAYQALERPLAEPALPAGLELNAGEKTRGWVTFQIREGAEIDSVTYSGADVELPAAVSR